MAIVFFMEKRMEMYNTRFQTESQKVLSQALILTGLMMIPTALGVYIGSLFTVGIWSLLFIFLASIGCIFAVAKMDRHNGLRLPVVGAFAVLIGVTMSLAITKTLSLANGAQIITSAVLSTAVTFGVAGWYGATTKKDLSGMGPALTIALIALVIVGIVNLFLGSSILALALSCISVVIFTLFTAYEINQIVNGGEDDPVMAAVGLYLNIINLFVSFLRIFTALDD